METSSTTKKSDEDFFKSIGVDLNEVSTKPIKPKDVNKKNSELSVAATLFSVTCASAVIGFFGTIALAKKRDGASLDKALVTRPGMTESGTKLAMRALKWGTIFAVGGFSLISLSIYQLVSFKDRNKLKKNQ